MEAKTQMIGVMVTQNYHKRLKDKAVDLKTTITDLMLSGVEKEILFRELEEKYSDNYVLTDDDAYDTKAMTRLAAREKIIKIEPFQDLPFIEIDFV